MKKMYFKIPLYKVHVTLVQAEKKEESEEVRKVLIRNHVGKEFIDDITDAVARGAQNGGDTFRDFRYKRMFIFFYPFATEQDRAETYSHEKRHIEDRVLEYFGVSDVESAGLLAGYLGEQFYKFWQL